MGILISVPVILSVNKLIKLNREINGRWISYLYTLVKLLIKRRSNKKGRFQVHDVWSSDPRHAGMIPFKFEYDYELPSKVFIILFFNFNYSQSIGYYLIISIG